MRLNTHGRTTQKELQDVLEISSGALSEILTVVLLVPSERPRPGEVERISARLREHGTALVIAGEWPHPESALHVTASKWEGLGTGYGFLDEREIAVQSQDRRGTLRHTVRFAGGSVVDPVAARVHRLVPR